MTYTEQLKDFKNHMDACFNVLMHHGSEEENEIFYNSDFKITFHGVTVTLVNGADVFQTIEEIIQREIDENEGF